MVVLHYLNALYFRYLFQPQWSVIKNLDGGETNLGRAYN